MQLGPQNAGVVQARGREVCTGNGTFPAQSGQACQRHPNFPRPNTPMIKWAILFGVISLIAGALGFGGLAGAFAGVAKIIFFLFISLCVLVLVLGIFIGKKLF